MPTPVTSKDVMYRKLVAGEFGNTAPVYFSVDDWKQSPNNGVPLWGIRSHISGDRRAKLDVPTAEVEDYCRLFGSDKFNITPMVDQWLVWRGEVLDTTTGLECFGAFGLSHLKWRPVMLRHATTTTGVAARHLLRSVLNENSYDDLMTLFEQYPGHAVEFTALSRCFGIVPHRNSVVWEVRCGHSGNYELSTWRKYL
jgi:hypothetical protein